MSICEQLFVGVNWTHILCAALLQHFFNFFWYGSLFANLWLRLIAQDKGVSSFDKAVQRHSMIKSVVVSFVASVARALFIMATINTLKMTQGTSCTFCAYLDAALFVAVISAIAQHNSLWGQHPLCLQVIEVGGDVASAALAGAALYFLSA